MPRYIRQLDIIGSNEPQYSVNHGQPPEHFKQLLPKAVVDVEEGEAEQEEEHVDDLVDGEAAGKADHDVCFSRRIHPVVGVDTCDWLPQTLKQHCMRSVSAMVTSVRAGEPSPSAASP